MAAFNIADIPTNVDGLLEKLIAYVGITARDHEPNGKRIERVGDSAIPTFVSNLEKFPDGNDYLVVRAVLKMKADYKTNGLQLWENVEADPNIADIQPQYKAV